MGWARRRVAYVVSRFPALTETFILEEVRDLRARGFDVDVLPLFGARGGEVHAAWPELRTATHGHRTLSLEMAAALVDGLAHHARPLAGAWAEALARTAPSRKLAVRAPVVLLKAALLARRLEAMGVAHVHAHWATHPALAAWAIQRLTGIGYSFTAHAHDLYVDRAMLREKVLGARFVVTISEFNRRLIERECGAEAAARVHVIRCGVDLAAFAAGQRRAAAGPPAFVCVAGLRPYKGHAVLLDAVSLLRTRGVDLRVVLVGDGELRGALEDRIAREGLADRVALRGALPHEEIPAALAGATAMVLPSVTARDGQMEGIPVALMEAMAAGVPVISTRLSGIPELVRDGETGLLVPERDAAALADAMARLAADRDLAARLADGGRRLVARDYDGRRNVERLAALLAPWTGPLKARSGAASPSPSSGASPWAPAAGASPPPGSAA
jgi:glycosyltransferase involved in cell wall biosynthesis